MLNAQDILTEMENFYRTPAPMNATVQEKTPVGVLTHGLIFLYNKTLSDYQRLQTEASKIAHFRQQFTVWKAVCARLDKSGTPYFKPGTQEISSVRYSYEFYDPKLDSVRAYPLFVEQFFPQLYYVLFRKNIFLGVKFTDADKARVTQLEQDFMRDAKHRQRTQDLTAFRRLFFGT